MSAANNDTKTTQRATARAIGESQENAMSTEQTIEDMQATCDHPRDRQSYDLERHEHGWRKHIRCRKCSKPMETINLSSIEAARLRENWGKGPSGVVSHETRRII